MSTVTTSETTAALVERMAGELLEILKRDNPPGFPAAARAFSGSHGSIANIRLHYERRPVKGHWFSPETMRFFGTRFPDDPIDVPALRCSLFLTTERGPDRVMAATVRVYSWDQADVDTLGDFHSMSLPYARRVLALLVERLKAA